MSQPTLLITGASSGIGAAAASALAKRGFRVFGTHRRSRPDADPEVEWLDMDVCDDASVTTGIAHVMNAAGRIDAVVCCAGFGIFGSVEDIDLDDAQRQFDTNFFGVLRVLRAVLPGLREVAANGGDARVVLVGSLAGRAPIPFQAHYSASKAAIDALSLALRIELRPLGIQVSLVEPGDIDTPFNEAMDWGDSQGSVYGEQLARCEAVIRESLPKAPGPAVVVRAIEKALTTRRPRVRYAVGADSKLVPFARRLLPDWLNLYLIRNHFDL
ncbi:MAG: SDR family NAD(P)-dependent oxidoreductase [Myxococcota bacterium]|nr:SDR family NAD(P)-dependent oxidoreductase [Myxococcota bacterium]